MRLTVHIHIFISSLCMVVVVVVMVLLLKVAQIEQVLWGGQGINAAPGE